MSLADKKKAQMQETPLRNSPSPVASGGRTKKDLVVEIEYFQELGKNMGLSRHLDPEFFLTLTNPQMEGLILQIRKNIFEHSKQNTGSRQQTNVESRSRDHVLKQLKPSRQFSGSAEDLDNWECEMTAYLDGAAGCEKNRLALLKNGFTGSPLQLLLRELDDFYKNNTSLLYYTSEDAIFFLRKIYLDLNLTDTITCKIQILKMDKDLNIYCKKFSEYAAKLNTDQPTFCRWFPSKTTLLSKEPALQRRHFFVGRIHAIGTKNL
jgi:hypothetical protein